MIIIIMVQPTMKKQYVGDRLQLIVVAFQALSRSEQDIFLMAQLKAMNDGEITASRRLKY